jgi:hypothetical protein
VFLWVYDEKNTTTDLFGACHLRIGGIGCGLRRRRLKRSGHII